jgi:hypothetical protein
MPRAAPLLAPTVAAFALAFALALPGAAAAALETPQKPPAAATPRPLPPGCVCNTLVAEKGGCCTPGDGGPAFPMTPCYCFTCFGGVFKAGRCPAPAACASTTCKAGETCVDTPAGAECQAEKGCACIALFQPVCCDVGGGRTETRGNSCECGQCGRGPGKVISDGECPGAPPPATCASTTCSVGATCVDTPAGAECVPREDCACTFDLHPVCCDLGGGKRVTRSNECTCTLCGTGGTVISDGRCPTKPPPATCASTTCSVGTTCVDTPAGVAFRLAPAGAECVPREDCACTLDLHPVCCDVGGGRRKTKSNACLCTRCGAGGKVLADGACRGAGTCANVKCTGGCVDTPAGPQCGTQPPTTE